MAGGRCTTACHTPSEPHARTLLTASWLMQIFLPLEDLLIGRGGSGKPPDMHRTRALTEGESHSHSSCSLCSRCNQCMLAGLLWSPTQSRRQWCAGGQGGEEHSEQNQAPHSALQRTSSVVRTKEVAAASVWWTDGRGGRWAVLTQTGAERRDCGCTHRIWGREEWLGPCSPDLRRRGRLGAVLEVRPRGGNQR